MRLHNTKKHESTKNLNFVFLYRLVFRSRLAVSLYELLIVMSIITILAALTVPIMGYYTPSFKLWGSSRIIINKLRQAQEEAVTTQIQHLIKFNSAVDPAPANIQLIKNDGGKIVLETFDLSNGVTISLSPQIVALENEIAFSPDGGPSVSGDITVTLGEASKTINVTPAGVIKL